MRAVLLSSILTIIGFLGMEWLETSSESKEKIEKEQ